MKSVTNNLCTNNNIKILNNIASASSSANGVNEWKYRQHHSAIAIHIVDRDGNTSIVIRTTMENELKKFRELSSTILVPHINYPGWPAVDQVSTK